jgi:tetratricopeptide (TPR) repeat protein
VLTTAAGIGLRFELEMLEAAFGDPDAVLDGVEEAESAQLILATAGRRGSRYEFSHALVRQTLLTELSAPRLHRLHLTIADAMEAMYGERAAEHAADIAHQLHEAGARADADRTRRYLKLAGEQAIAAAAPDEALVAFDRALALTGANAPDQRALLLYQRGFALRALGRHAEATDDWFEALPVLEASGHTAAVADICRQVAYIYLWALRIEDALALAKRGLEAVGDAPSRERSRLEAVWGIVHSVKADCEVADRWIRGAVALGTEQGDLRLLGGELMQLQLLQFEHSQRIADMVETGGRAIDLVRRYGTPWEQASTIGATLLGWVWAGDFASQKRHVDPLLPVAEAEGNIGAMFHCLCGSALAALASDDLADAIEKATRGIDLAAQYQLAWGTVASLYRGVARMWAGQFEGAAADFEECVVRRLPAPCHLGLEPAAALYGFAMMGDPRAAELYDRDDFPLPVLGRDNAQGAWHWCIAKIQAAVLLGRPEEAGAWLPHVEQLMRQGMMVTSGQGLAAKVAGIAAAARGDREVAERHFETALRQADELPYHTEQAEVRRWYAWALERFGRQHDRARVEALRAASAAKFQALGGFQPPMRPGEQIGL